MVPYLAHGIPRLSRRSAIWAVALSFLAVTAFSTTPSALYGIYARRDHLSSLTITIVYAVYAGGIVVSLILAGHVSDWYGRRRVLLTALGVAVLAASVFLVWKSLPGLLVARVLTGVALGVTVPTATAFITDLDTRPGGVATRRAGIVATVANIGGLGLGPLIAGLLARYEPHPLTLAFLVLLAGLLAAVGLVAAAPEGHPAVDPRPRYQPQRLAAPTNGRRLFLAATAGAFSAFAVGGLLVGLTGTFLTELVHHSSPALIGAAIFMSNSAGVLVQTTTTSWPPQRLLAAGIPPIILGLCLLVVSAWTSPPSLALFLVSAVVAGAGIGAMIRGCLTIVISAAHPDDLAGAVATLFTAGYTGVSVPVVGAGIALQYLSPRVTLLIFALVVVVGILAVSPILVRPAASSPQSSQPGTGPMAALCRCFGADVANGYVEPSHIDRDGPIHPPAATTDPTGIGGTPDRNLWPDPR